MHEYYPLLLCGGVIGLFSAIFIFAYATMKDKKEAVGFDRNMKDGELIRRMIVYARPHWKSFALAVVLMILTTLMIMLYRKVTNAKELEGVG